MSTVRSSNDKRASQPTFAGVQRNQSLLELEAWMPSVIGAISPMVEQLMRFIEGSRCVVGNEFDVKFALREALNNAVIHGNGMDPGKLLDVRCRCERGKGVWPKQLGSAHRRIARVPPQGYGASARGSRGLRWRVEAAGMTRNCPHRMKGRRDTQWQNRAATFGLITGLSTKDEDMPSSVVDASTQRDADVSAASLAEMETDEALVAAAKSGDARAFAVRKEPRLAWT